jgi:hypothetical protein
MLVASCLGLLFSGCSTSERTNEPVAAPVSGTVTLDGNPIPRAQLLFIDVEATPARTYIAEAVDGKFRGAASAGKKRVEIRAYREDVASSAGGAPGDVDPQYLPPRYNSDSELVVEVGPDGADSLSFEVTSR